MKVVYAKRIDEKLSDAIHDAAATLRKIEYIEVTGKEMDELISRCGHYWTFPKSPAMFMGVALKVVE